MKLPIIIVLIMITFVFSTTSFIKKSSKSDEPFWPDREWLPWWDREAVKYFDFKAKVEQAMKDDDETDT